MNKIVKSIIALFSLSLLLTSCGGSSPEPTTESGDTSAPTTSTPSSSSSSGTSTTEPEDIATYYSSIGNEEGTDLRDALNTLNTKKKTKSFAYADIKAYSKYTERPASGDEVPVDKMVGFYNNALVNANWDNQQTWNREHVWPNSLGGGKVEGDLFMTRPCHVSVNSERGNKHYGEIKEDDPDTKQLYDPGMYVPEYRGIAARIIFYCAIAKKELKIADRNESVSGSNTMGKLSDLLRWNLEYLPSTSPDASLALRVEQNRNDVVQKQQNPQLQGNRNPFVDHPEYACRIWGRTNDETKRICGIN